MPQVLCGKRVTEFVKEVVLAVWTFQAAVAMFGDALSKSTMVYLKGVQSKDVLEKINAGALAGYVASRAASD